MRRRAASARARARAHTGARETGSNRSGLIERVSIFSAHSTFTRTSDIIDR